MNKHLTGYVVALAFGVGAGFALKPDTPNFQTSNSVMVSPSTSHSIDKVESSPDSATAPIIEQTANPTLSALLQTTDLNQHLSIAYQLSKDADQGQLTTLLDQLKEQQTDTNLTVAARVFLLRLSAFSPQAAVDKYQQLYDKPNKAQQDLMYMLYHQYAMQDLDGAINSMPGLTLKHMRKNLFYYLLQDKHFRDSPTLIAAAEAFSPDLKAYVAQITSDSAQQWFERLLAMQSNNYKMRSQFYLVLRKWASEDPEQGVAYLTALKEQNPKAKEWLRKLVNAWVEIAPIDALNSAIANGWDTKQISSMMTQLAYNSPDKALELFDQYKGQLDDKVQVSIYQGWLSTSPKQAADYIRQLDEQQQKSLLSNRRVLQKFASLDPQGTFELAKKWGLFKNTELEFSVTSAFSQLPFEQSNQFWQELPASREKDLLFATITQKLAQTDIVAAKKWLKDNSETVTRVPHSMSFMLYEMTKESPKQAADYVLSIEDEKLQSQAAATTVGSWYRQDPDAAIKWALSLSQGNTQDRAIAMLVHQIGRRDKETTLKLLNAVSDQEVHQKLSSYLEGQ